MYLNMVSINQGMCKINFCTIFHEKSDMLYKISGLVYQCM